MYSCMSMAFSEGSLSKLGGFAFRVNWFWMRMFWFCIVWLMCTDRLGIRLLLPVYMLNLHISFSGMRVHAVNDKENVCVSIPLFFDWL